MANLIKIKRSAVASKVPLTTDLELGELAINTYDGKLFLKKNDGTESIVTIGESSGGTPGGADTQLQYNNAGVFGGISTLTYNGTTVSSSADMLINGLTVGKGTGSISTNTVFGASALISNSTGNENIATGFSALYSNTTGFFNLATGYEALRFNTTGWGNTATGNQALMYITQADENTAYGAYAGQYLEVGLATVTITNAGSGYNDGTWTDINLVPAGVLPSYTSTSKATVTILGGSVTAVSITTPGGSFNIGDTFVFGSNIGDGAGANFLCTAATLVKPTYNVAIGPYTLAGTGSYNVAVGTSVLENNRSGNYNTGIGHDALKRNTTGSENVAIGVSSLSSNTTGSNNVVNGGNALLLNTSGSNNVAIGDAALLRNITGSGNVALGNSSGKYETGSNTFYVDNQDRTNTAGDKAGALLYGTFNATPANQTLKINAALSVTYGVTLNGTLTAGGAVGVSGQVLSSTGTGVQWVNAVAGATGFTGSVGINGYTGSRGDTGLLTITPAETPPTSPPDSSVWYDTNTGKSYVYYNDGTSSQWILFADPTVTDGDTGFTGSIGFTGSAGFVGSTGFTGSVGFVGSQGTTGFTGSAGFVGSAGINGFTGSIGFTGSAGTNGFTGSVGFVGSQGDLGYTGSKGDIGYTGSSPTPNLISQGDSNVTVTDTGSNGTITLATDNTTRVTVSNLGDVGIGGTPLNFADYTTLVINGPAHPTLARGGGDLVLSRDSVTIGDMYSQSNGIYLDAYNSNSAQLGSFKISSDGAELYSTNSAVSIGVGTYGLTIQNNGGWYIDGTPGTIGQVLTSNGAAAPSWQNVVGYAGSQGVTGFTGSVGFVGSQGNIGYTGSTGVGFTGSQGNLGFTGSKGDIGFTGSIGFVGSQGVGFTGSQGIIGYTGSAGTGGGGASVTTSVTAPISPSDGDLWWNEEEGQLKIYYNDGTSSQWVDASTSSIGYTGSSGILESETAPVDTGILWLDVNDTTLYPGEFSSITLNGALTETVYAVSGTTPALTPSNGTIQTWTLSGSSTPTAGTWNSGESLTLMVNDGTAFTITWTSIPVTWVGGSAPTLATSGYTVIELWKVGTTIYGALVGNVA